MLHNGRDLAVGSPIPLVGPGGKSWPAELHRLPSAQGTQEVDRVPFSGPRTTHLSKEEGDLIASIPSSPGGGEGLKPWILPYYVHIRAQPSLPSVHSNRESWGLACSVAWGLDGKVLSAGKPSGVPQSRLTWAPAGLVSPGPPIPDSAVSRPRHRAQSVWHGEPSSAGDAGAESRSEVEKASPKSPGTCTESAGH